MSGRDPNLKVRATMDNSDLKKKSQENKAALRDFEKTGTDAVGKLGEAFGVNTGKIDQMLSSVRGLGVSLEQSGKAGAAAFGKMLQGISGVTAGIAGIGLAGALATFKMLSAEADNFKNTLAGANIEAATAAYVDTYRQVVHDFNRDLGKGFADTESSWKKFWGTIGANMKAYVTSGAIVSALNPQAQGLGTQGFSTYNTLQNQAADAAKEAERISNEIYKVQRQISDKTVEWARLEAQIAESKRIAYDTTNDSLTQQQALMETVSLIKQRYEEEVILRGQLADLQFEYNSLAESSIADIDKANQLRVQEEATIARMNNAIRELARRQATVAKNVQEEAQARQQALLAAQQLRSLNQNWLENSAITTTVETPGAKVMNEKGLEVPVRPVLNAQDAVDVTSELQSIITSSFDSISTTIGGLIGDLATGGDAWGNFANAAVSAFGDMAIAIGKMAIATGTATLGIKAALTSLNPYVAIAAGAALVALGTAVKAGMSNIANGNYSASSSVASSTGSYGGSSSYIGTGFENREMNIKVSGKVVASGNQLMVVLENEKKRKNHTT